MTSLNRARGTVTRLKTDSGISLIETMIALGILSVLMGGVVGLAAMATSITENQGHLAPRTTEYAVDKIEQLLELTYGDAQSNTTVFPSATVGGVGLAAGGSTNTAAPVTGYVDYLDQNGNVLCSVATPCTAAAPANWYYKRVWQIAVPAANMKRITVTAIVRTSYAGALISQSTVTVLKSNCPSGC